MKNFSAVRFRGTFRDYQQAVLRRAQKHLLDGKIHIVAAPGSGKTVLGLELICRLNAPALVLSPSVTIRQQWGERFVERFLPKGAEEADYISYDITQPSAITSITYQALHAAMTRQALEADADEDAFASEATQDFAAFDLMEAVRLAGIRTVCLDEAHHLKSEWQKALEAFVTALAGQVKIIALTATPPYDSTPAEWERYSRLCGEIDEEIFVPQLVAQGTLCPHQDYIAFSYPTAEEETLLKAHRARADACVASVLEDGLAADLLRSFGAFDPNEEQEAKILEHRAGFAALLSLAEKSGLTVKKNTVDLICPTGKLPEVDLAVCESAFQLVLDEADGFDKSLVEALQSRLAERDLIEKRRVCLLETDALRRRLASSLGKLDSITELVRAEAASLGSDLRMLVLTDYIKRDLMRLVGTAEPIPSMGAVPIFEAIRRTTAEPIGLLSGSLVLAPMAEAEAITAIAESMDVACRVREVENTAHAEIILSGSNKNKVAVITEAFRRGHIRVLVGTKSLLGEGWDSPCINSLILASFVGSFMLSNQMRGRAIRIDANQPQKASNIFHLVTLDPFSDTLAGADYAMLTRRFMGFLAPAYQSDRIESGTDRIDILEPPFDRSGIARINRKTMALAADRSGMAARWRSALNGKEHPEVLDVCEIPAAAQPVGLKKIVPMIAFAALFLLDLLLLFAKGGFFRFIGWIGLPFALFFLIRAIVRFVRVATPARALKTVLSALLDTLRDTKKITSANVRLSVEAGRGEGELLALLSGATAQEKRAFSQSVSEFLSAIDDPRYVLVENCRLGPVWKNSFACPALLGTKKETAERLAKRLSRTGCRFAAAYTRADGGKRTLTQCKKQSCRNRAGVRVTGKKIVR